MMTIGLLVQDDSKLTNREKVIKASGLYLERFGHMPNVCYLSLNETCEPIEGIWIKTAKNVMVNYIWLGVEESRFGL